MVPSRPLKVNRARTSHAQRARGRRLIGKDTASGVEGLGVRFLPGSLEVDPH